MWYRYMDKRSGGFRKTAWEYVHVEADSREQADARFTERTEQSPDNVTCPCCGADYSVTEDETLEESTAYDRGGCLVVTAGGRLDLASARTPLAEYLEAHPADVLVLAAP